jgi:hypothetical protein
MAAYLRTVRNVIESLQCRVRTIFSTSWIGAGIRIPDHSRWFRDARLGRLERDVTDLKADVGFLKSDIAALKRTW